MDKKQVAKQLEKIVGKRFEKIKNVELEIEKSNFELQSMYTDSVNSPDFLLVGEINNIPVDIYFLIDRYGQLYITEVSVG